MHTHEHAHTQKKALLPLFLWWDVSGRGHWQCVGVHYEWRFIMFPVESHTCGYYVHTQTGWKTHWSINL